jgi:hypothetical protein
MVTSQWGYSLSNTFVRYFLCENITECAYTNQDGCTSLGDMISHKPSISDQNVMPLLHYVIKTQNGLREVYQSLVCCYSFTRETVKSTQDT